MKNNKITNVLFLFLFVGGSLFTMEVEETVGPEAFKIEVQKVRDKIKLIQASDDILTPIITSFYANPEPITILPSGSFNQEPCYNKNHHTDTILTLSNNFITTFNKKLKSGEQNTSDLNCVKVSEHLNFFIKIIRSKLINTMVEKLFESDGFKSLPNPDKKKIERLKEKILIYSILLATVSPHSNPTYSSSQEIGILNALYMPKTDVDILNSLENSLSPIVEFHYKNNYNLNNWVEIMTLQKTD